MKVIVFGATGMVGQGVVRACLRDPGIDRVLVVTRSPVETKHDKLGEIIHKDFSQFDDIAALLTGYDACFFCLGVSSVGMTEDDYRHVTYDFTLAAARVLARVNPTMVFTYVSGSGTDSTEKGRWMWARVKGKTENDLLALPFGAAYMVRAAYIQPERGIKSKTRLYRVLYAVLAPFYPLLKALFPKQVTSTEAVGRAMIALARSRSPSRAIENADINTIAAAAAQP